MTRYFRIALDLIRAGRLRYLASLILWRTGLCILFTIPQRGFKLRFYPTALSAALWVNPEDRYEDSDFLESYLRQGDTVIDVGANIGSTALLASRLVGADGSVYAFEPHPRTFRFLQGNIALNRAANIRAYPFALGDQQASARLTDQKGDDQNTVTQADSGIPITIKRLDDLIPPDQRIALLKIDIEGYELFALRGASTTLARTECVYLEYYEPFFTAQGYTGEEVLSLLHAAGFAFYIGANSAWAPITAVPKPPHPINLIAVRSGGRVRHAT